MFTAVFCRDICQNVIAYVALYDDVIQSVSYSAFDVFLLLCSVTKTGFVVSSFCFFEVIPNNKYATIGFRVICFLRHRLFLLLWYSFHRIYPLCVCSVQSGVLLPFVLLPFVILPFVLLPFVLLPFVYFTSTFPSTSSMRKRIVALCLIAPSPISDRHKSRRVAYRLGVQPQIEDNSGYHVGLPLRRVR